MIRGYFTPWKTGRYTPAHVDGSHAQRSTLLSQALGGNRIMPKQKTHKGMKRRFKLTASGKATHRSAYRGHLLSGKAAKRKQRLRNGGIVVGAEAKLIAEALRPGL